MSYDKMTLSEQTTYRLNHPDQFYSMNPFLQLADEISNRWNRKNKKDNRKFSPKRLS
jgi:hypothetical protein